MRRDDGSAILSNGKPAGDPRRRRRLAWTLLRVALALGLMVVVVRMNRDVFRQVLGHRPDARAFALAFACYLAATVLAFLRWHMLVRAVGLACRWLDAIRFGFIGLLFNLVIPGAIGGDFVKAAFLARAQQRKAAAIATVVIDRLISVFSLFLLAGLTGAIGWDSIDRPARKLVTTAWIATAIVATLLAVAFTPALYRPLVAMAAQRPKARRRLADLVAAGTAYRDRFHVILGAIVLALTTYALHVLAFYLASRALFADVPGLADHYLIVPLVLFTTAIPLPFGALGVSEQISSGAFRLARASGAAAYRGGAVAMMAFKLLQCGGALIGGVVYLANRDEVRALQAEAEAIAGGDAPDLSPDPAAEAAPAPAR